MKHLLVTTVSIMFMASLAIPAVAATHAPVIAKKAKAVAPKVVEEAEPAVEEIDHNAMPEDSSADVSIEIPPAPETIGKPRPKAKKSKLPAKEIPLIDTSYEGKSSDDVTYVTGGVGKDERDAIEAAKADYNLYITSANATGEFVGETKVVISRKNDDEVEEVLNVESGPLLYVRLPAGSYTLVAELGEQKKEQKINVVAQGKAQTIRLGWK